MKVKGPIIRSWICENCLIVFEINGKIKKAKPFCPSCGDPFDVKRYQSKYHGDMMKGWTEEELKVLGRCESGELLPYQVAVMLNRSLGSVNQKLKRERYHGHQRIIWWSDDELALLDQCIKGELKIYHVAQKTGRTIDSVRKRLQRRKKELCTDV